VARDAAGGVGGVEEGEMNDRLDPYWLGRLQAIGKMQARYLWLLVVASVFYFGLSSGILRPTNGDVKVPVLNLNSASDLFWLPGRLSCPSSSSSS